MRLIDADALIAEYDRVHIGPPGGARKLMEDAPTIDPEELRPKGRWIDNVDENGILCNAWRKCSACGGLNYKMKPNYCPNCGADMRGGNDG